MSFKRTCDTRPPYRPPSPPSNRVDPAPTHNASVYCQPSEDADYTVTDLLPNPVTRNAYNFHSQLDRIRQNTPFSIANNVMCHVTYGDMFPERVTVSDTDSSGLSELNLHSDLNQSNTKEEQSEHGENLEAMFSTHSRKEQSHEKSHGTRKPTITEWTSTEDVDSPGFGARPAENDTVAIPRHDYNRLLENHERFIVSNAQLYNIKEELLGRVADQEVELSQARSIIESLELDKQRLKDEVDSLQKMVSIVKVQMPLLATEAGQPWQQATNKKHNDADEWTSSLKEELRQTIFLALDQQQQLHGLYRVIKQQNEAIRQLTMTSDPKSRPQRPLQGNKGLPKYSFETRALNELESRQNPEGSSVSAQEKVKGKRELSRDPERPEVRTGSIAIPLKESFRKIFGTRIGGSPPNDAPKPPRCTTSTTTGISSSPLATVTKGRPAVAKQYTPSSYAVGPVKSHDREVVAVKGPPGTYPIVSQNEFEHGVANSYLDLENAGFVFVNSSRAETRICPLCSAEFSSEGTKLEQFVEHVSQCVPPMEHRQCPVCLQKFENSVLDREIEQHVNDHFEEDRFQCISLENK